MGFRALFRSLRAEVFQCKENGPFWSTFGSHGQLRERDTALPGQHEHAVGMEGTEAQRWAGMPIFWPQMSRSFLIAKGQPAAIPPSTAPSLLSCRSPTLNTLRILSPDLLLSP